MGAWLRSDPVDRGSGDPRVCLVSRREPGTTGTSRYAGEVPRSLTESGIDFVHVATQPAGLAARVLSMSQIVGIDAKAFLAQYPMRLAWPEADVYHLTVQTYASALVSGRPPGRVVVTVHDIIPYLVRRNPCLRAYRHPAHRFFDWLALIGLRRADALMADSRWTRETLIKHLGIPAERITVVPLGVDRAHYRPLTVPRELRQRYGLSEDCRYVLYVGSEDPRKNLDTLWRAFAMVHWRRPDTRLIKVGVPHTRAERARLTELGRQLGIAHAVSYFDHVPEDDLPLFYNLASVCAMPSLYEGFGLPVVEALACGTPVVCSDRASLAELGAMGATVVPPTPSDFAAALESLLEDDATHGRGGARRTASSGVRSWTECGRDILSVYQAVLSAPRESVKVESLA